MLRREFLAFVGHAALVWPVAAGAQQLGRTRRIGVLYPGTVDNPLSLKGRSLFRDELSRLGWTEGKNILIEYRYANEDAGRLPAMARELVELQPEVIFATTVAPVVALTRATKTIPIVFAGVGNPLGTGVVSNLARPGGNVTGFAAAAAQPSKLVEFLKEISPGISRVALMFNPDTSGYSQGVGAVNEFLAAAAQLKMEGNVAEVRSRPDVEAAIAALAREPRGGLVVGQDIFNVRNRAFVIELASQHGVLAAYPLKLAMDGGLISYGIDTFHGIREAAGYIDRILKGEKAGDLPVQLPTKFELIINLKAAKALGITVPSTLLIRADEVIE